jgi:hypothetical protein
VNYNQRIYPKAVFSDSDDSSMRYDTRLFNAGTCLRQDYKVFILSLDGLSPRSAKKPNQIRPIPRLRLLKLQLTVLVLKILGYRQASVSEANDCNVGRYYCPVLDVHDMRTLSDLQQLQKQFKKATLFIAPSFISDFKSSDAALQWEKFRAATKDGWEIGLAGYRYVNLTSLRHSAQQTEISKSHKVISDRIGIAPKVAAFPAGTFDATTISCCKESGITMGIGFSGLFEIGGKSKHLAPKLSASRMTLKNLASVSSFNYNKVVKIDSEQAHNEPEEKRLSTGAK